MNYFWAFVTGGAICVVGQLFLDLTALTPARILTGYVVAGVVLSALASNGANEFAGQVPPFSTAASRICLPKACALPLPKREPSAS